MSALSHALQRRIHALRDHLDTAPHQRGATSFFPVFDHFFDIADDERFLAAGAPIDATPWLPALNGVARSALGRPVSVHLLRAFEVPGAGLRHGGLLVEGRPGCFFAFDNGRGLVSFLDEVGHTRISRVTLVVAGEVAEG